MKKLSILTVLLILPLLTACGSSNKLKCVRDFGNYSRELIIKFDSKKEKPIAAEIYYTVDFSKVTDFSEFGCKDLDDCMKKADESLQGCEQSNDYGSCKITKKTKTGFTVYGSMTKEYIEKQLGNKNYSDIKTMMETDGGFTCK